MNTTPSPPPGHLARDSLALLDDVEKRLLLSLLLALGFTLVVAAGFLGWSGWVAILASGMATALVFCLSLVGAYLGLQLLRLTLRRQLAGRDAEALAGLALRTGRYLGVTLEPRREAILGQVNRSVEGIEAKVRLLPNAGLRPLAEAMVAQQRDLLPEVEHSLRLAQYLEDQARELASRTADPAVLAKVDHVQGRVAEMDAEARRVADLATDCEASLLATLSERDDRLLTALFAEYSERFQDHYEIVREVNDELRGLVVPDPAWWPSAGLAAAGSVPAAGRSSRGQTAAGGR